MLGSIHVNIVRHPTKLTLSCVRSRGIVPIDERKLEVQLSISLPHVVFWLEHLFSHKEN